MNSSNVPRPFTPLLEPERHSSAPLSWRPDVRARENALEVVHDRFGQEEGPTLLTFTRPEDGHEIYPSTHPGAIGRNNPARRWS